MNNLSKVTKERLQKIASWRETYGNGHNVMIPAEEAELIVSELMTLREAAERPVAIVEHSGYITAAQMVGDEPRRKAVKELYEGALVVGQSLFTAPPQPDEITPDAQAAGKAALLKLLEEPQRIQLSGYSEATLDAVNSPVIPDGWALVPIKPTDEMRDAWFFMEDFDSEWSAMLAAASKPE